MTILQDRARQIFSFNMLRLAGYSLLIVTVVNIFLGLIPLQLMNPLWELQTIGAIIDKIPFILLGMVLVYYQKQNIHILDSSILKSLSWLSLVAAISLLLILPLNIANSLRIYHQPDTTSNTNVINQNEITQQFEQQLQTANSIAEIRIVLQEQVSQKVNIPDSVDIQKLKTDILINLQHNQNTINNSAGAFRVQKRSWLIKQCIKWNIGALIGSILFFVVWNNTIWARIDAN